MFAQCLLELGFRALFLLGQDLSPMWVRFAVGAALLGQLKGWPIGRNLPKLNRPGLIEAGP